MKGSVLEINKILEAYASHLAEDIEKIIDETADEGVEKLKKNSPKRTGAYSKDWVKTKRKENTVLHNKKHYQLTHLLEKGHLTVNGKRVSPQKHIEPVEEQIIDEIVKKVLKKAHDA